MRKELEGILFPVEMPEWLSSGDFSFDVNKILEDSLYYPASGLHGGIVKSFMGYVYSFLYVDFSFSKESFLEDLNSTGFKGYHIIHQQSISINQLIPRGWNTFIPPDNININWFKDYYRSIPVPEPFCEWVVFERNEDLDESHNPKRFSLLFLCADCVAAYQAVYLSNRIKPKMIAMINCDGFSLNWTHLRDRNEIFAKSVLYDINLTPEYLIIFDTHNNRNPWWPEYNKFVCELLVSNGFATIWQKNV